MGIETLRFKNEPLYQGSLWEYGFVLVDDADEPVPLVDGCEARMQARVRASDPTPVLDITATIDLTESLIHFQILPEDTVGQTWKTAGFDAELRWPNGDVNKLFTGLFRLIPEFTR